MTGLSRKLINLATAVGYVHANQWLERTLDDSAQRRMDLAEGYLLADAVLNLYQNISGGMVVLPKMIARHLREELPFMATEEILMDACQRGIDRQVAHEIIRQHAVAAGARVKQEGRDNNLIERLAGDERLGLGKEYFDGLMSSPARFVGWAPGQTREFLKDYVRPLLARYAGRAITKDDVRV